MSNKESDVSSVSSASSNKGKDAKGKGAKGKAKGKAKSSPSTKTPRYIEEDTATAFLDVIKKVKSLLEDGKKMNPMMAEMCGSVLNAVEATRRKKLPARNTKGRTPVKILKKTPA
jgi:hypothetical protein